jgi:uncharacterized caspase-like protein
MRAPGAPEGSLRNLSKLSFRGAVGDEESRTSSISRARFLASLGMTSRTRESSPIPGTRFRKVFQQPAKTAVLAFVSLALVFVPRVRAEGECGAAQDFMVQAREKITPQATRSDLEDGLVLLKHANELCAESGDAWYYRSLFEKKLGHGPQADFAMRQAKLMGSDALAQRVDPFALAAPAPVEAAPKELQTPVRGKWALVVGIEKFQNPNIPALHYTGADASGLAAVLSDRSYGRFAPDHVTLLTDAQATTKGIKAALNLIARSAGPDDLVVIYVATHGSPRENMPGGVNYLITYDTDPSSIDTLYGSALPMVELDEAVRSRFRANRVVILLDTCHSGGIRRAGVGGYEGSAPVAMNGAMNGAGAALPIAAALAAQGARGFKVSAPSAANLESMKPGLGRVIIASSSEDQESFESKALGGGHGYFTYYLIEDLKRNQGLDPVSKIYSDLKDQVGQQARRDGRPAQTPVMYQSTQVPEIVIGIVPQLAVLPGRLPLPASMGF